MSYCVHCGVELDKTATSCPLCNTKVINPSEKIDKTSPKPYPEEKGQTDQGIRRDLIILATTSLSTIAIVCGLVNYFFFRNTLWSLYIIGICILLWIFLLPMFFAGKMHPVAAILLDGVGVIAYFATIAYQHPGHGWYVHIVMPLVALCTVLLIIFTYCYRRPWRSILTQAAVFFAELAVLCVGIELITRQYAGVPVTIEWSAIVLICCVVIDVILITILRRSRLREEVRRRMHI